MLVILLIAGCVREGGSRRDEPYVWPGCDVSAALSVDEGPPVAGDVPLTVTLASPEGEPASVDLKYSLDGQAWQEASFEADPGDLATSAEGAAHALTWRSLADLGEGWFEGVALKAVPSIACGPGESAIVSDLIVENTGDAVPRCEIDLPPLDSPQDGAITLRFTLSHAESASADVAARYRLAGGEALPATLTLADCDGDGAIDEGRELATAPGGAEHCLVWDSQQDLTLDGEAQVELDCVVGNAVEDTAQSNAFALENDPTPAAGEVVFSEMMLDSNHPEGEYIELQNATGHVLNVHGLTLSRCYITYPDGVTCVELLLEDSSETLLLDPQSPLLLAGTDEREENGCLDPDLTWGDDFSARDASFFHLSRGEELIASLNTVTKFVGAFERGIALGLSSDAIAAKDWNEPDNWCQQSAQIPACAEAEFTEQGTPGAANGPCP